MIFSCDTETDGLDPFKGDRPFAITTCNMKGKTDYIDIGKDNLIPIDLALNAKRNEVVFHNAKFDILMLMAQGMRVNATVHDTMIAAAIYNSDEITLKLKDLAKKYLKEDNDEEIKVKDYMRKHKLTSFKDVPRELIEPYARKDASITLSLFKFYRAAGITSDPIYAIEMRLLRCLVDMQRRGVLIDTEFCGENSKACEEKISEIEKKINEFKAGINTNSSKQLAKFLFEEEGIRCDYLTEKGNPAFDEFHMQKYDHPIIPLILEMRSLQKINTTYLKTLLEKSDDKNQIHCDFFQVGARTGRFSCRTPNLQNIPRSGVVDVRRAFTCRDGYSNYYFDYSQIELRILAHYSQDPIMLEEFSKEENDLHAVTCQAVFGEVTPQKRNLSKNINFGIIYGMGPKKFCQMVNEQYPDFNLSYTDARAYINKYYETYKKVRIFTWRVPQKILDVGYVKDVFGRKYTCPPRESYKGVNYLIQGCAAGIIKKAMIEIHTLLENKKSNILLTIHDELVIEVHKSEEILVDQIKAVMEDRETFRVPILVNVEKTETDWSQKSALVVTR